MRSTSGCTWIGPALTASTAPYTCHFHTRVWPRLLGSTVKWSIKTMCKAIVGCMFLYDIHIVHWRAFVLWNAPERPTFTEGIEGIARTFYTESVLFYLYACARTVLEYIGFPPLKLPSTEDKKSKKPVPKNSSAVQSHPPQSLMHKLRQGCIHLLCILFFACIMLIA